MDFDKKVASTGTDIGWGSPEENAAIGIRL
jgi:hypothetical protein